MRQLLFAVLATIAIALPTAFAETSPQTRTYAAIFEIALDADGKPTAIKAVMVIDPATGSKEPVDVPVPEKIVAHAWEQWKDKSYEAGRTSVFGYQYFTRME
jgi:hypothetical protein